jgi:hypothetical protein
MAGLIYTNAVVQDDFNGCRRARKRCGGEIVPEAAPTAEILIQPAFGAGLRRNNNSVLNGTGAIGNRISDEAGAIRGQFEEQSNGLAYSISNARVRQL